MYGKFYFMNSFRFYFTLFTRKKLCFFNWNFRKIYLIRLRRMKHAIVNDKVTNLKGNLKTEKQK